MTSSHLAFRTGRGRPVCPAEDSTENPIHEPAGISASKDFGKLHRLVDGGLCWYSIIEQNLVDCKPQDIFINLCHLWQRPVTRSCLLNLRVNSRDMAKHTLYEFFRKVYHARRKIPLRGMSFDNALKAMPAQIIFIECLQSDHSSLPARAN